MNLTDLAEAIELPAIRTAERAWDIAQTRVRRRRYGMLSAVAGVLAVVAGLAVLNAGPWFDDSKPDATAVDTPSTSPSSWSVTWHQSRGDVYYREASEPDFELTNEAGEVQEPVAQGDVWIWEQLPEGTYTFRGGGVRPCSASCDSFDPFADECSDLLVVEAILNARVRLTPGDACTTVSTEPKGPHKTAPPSSQATVPSLIGLRLDEAVRAGDLSGLKVKVSPDSQGNYVVAQSPDGGTIVGSGTVLQLVPGPQS